MNNIKKSNNDKRKKGEGAGVGRGGQGLLEQLPSEQDRKAVMGCLAAVLNMMFASRQRLDVAAVTPVSVSAHVPPASAGVGSGGDAVMAVDSTAAAGTTTDLNSSLAAQEDESEDSKGAAADTAAPVVPVPFSIRQDQKEDEEQQSSSEWFGKSTATKEKEQQLKTMRRTKSFQKELLNISAELLFLSADHAAVFLPNLDIQCDDEAGEKELLLQPFLQSLSSAEESFRCIALLMFRFLLVSGEGKPIEKKKGNEDDNSDYSALANMTIVGYDARVRFAFKYLAVSILSHWELKEHASFMTPESAAAYATRRFEALEDGIASRLSTLSQILSEEKQKGSKSGAALAGQKKQSTFGQNAVRGLKIGAAGVAAGTLFAITGGLAAPAIVGGIAALAGASSAATVIATVLLLPAATTIFGVGGGTIVASKMSKRTAGLSEFDIEKVTSPDSDHGTDGKKKKKTAKSDDGDSPELSRTVCISGWIRDAHDFERPFGISPQNLTDRHELLCRYCSVYAPHIIPECRTILKEWQGKEDELWDMCKTSYGKDPSSLYPFDKGPRYDAKLTDDEDYAVDDLIRALGLPFPARAVDIKQSSKQPEPGDLPPTVDLFSDVLAPSSSSGDNKSSNILEKSKKQITTATAAPDATTLRSYKAWDFNAEYGSEQYIVRWEKDLLAELYGSAKEFQMGLAKKAGKEVLKQTAMKTLLAAVALPSTLLSLADLIDEKWMLVAERADEAGIVLAQSLLNSNAGHRPVSLVGFSFGARMIVSCLKELARNQLIWESQQEGKDQTESKVASSLRKSLSTMSTKQREAQLVEFSREPASIVEDVILMGCPASVNKATWLSCREIVGGRLVNCFSQNDMMLAFMYRMKNITSSLLSPPVGISNVNLAGIENYDVSKFVASHGEYCVAVKEILNQVGYDQPAKIKTMQTS